MIEFGGRGAAPGLGAEQGGKAGFQFGAFSRRALVAYR